MDIEFFFIICRCEARRSFQDPAQCLIPPVAVVISIIHIHTLLSIRRAFYPLFSVHNIFVNTRDPVKDTRKKNNKNARIQIYTYTYIHAYLEKKS